MAASPSPPVTRQPLWLLQAAVGFFLLLKLVYFVYLPPIGDEAYYWLWGQRPALSYLDHPPLHAWLMGLVSLAFGWNVLSLRLLTWITFAVDVLVLWLFARRLAPDGWRPWFWTSLAIYLGSPILFVLGSIAFHDHLMIAFCLLSGFFFTGFVEDWAVGRRRYGRLYLTALFLGLALLSKYNAALLGLGYLIVILANRDLRPLFRRWQTYAAAAIVVILQAPVIDWNLVNGLASFRFHAVDRWEGDDGGVGFSLEEALATLIASALILTPFLIVPILRVFRPAGNDAERALRPVAGAVFGVSTAIIAVLGAFVNVLYYWNSVAYPLAVPILPRTLRTRTVFWLHLAFGAFLSVSFLIDMAFAPLIQLPGFAFPRVYTNYDWDQVVADIDAAKAAHPVGFIGATRYTTAAQLAFATHDPNVTDISTRHTEFNYWFDSRTHVGEDALVLAAPFIPITYAATQFRSTTLLQTIEIRRLGQLVGTYQLYLAQGYCGGTCP